MGILKLQLHAEERTGDFLESSAGGFTIDLSDQRAYSEPAPVLTYNQMKVFKRGRVHFNQRWVAFPLPAGDWGLGPTFVADRCAARHLSGGRGNDPASEKDQLLSILVRISIPGEGKNGAPKLHPNYGDQLQNAGLVGKEKMEDRDFSDGQVLGERVKPEAKLYVNWIIQKQHYTDGEEIELRKPELNVMDLIFGPLGDEVMYSLRIAQPAYGLGLLEAVS